MDKVKVTRSGVNMWIDKCDIGSYKKQGFVEIIQPKKEVKPKKVKKEKEVKKEK